MFKKIYNTIINQGVCNNNSATINKRIQLLNTYSLIWIHFTILFPVSDYLTKEVDAVVINSTIAQLLTLLSLVIVIVLNKYTFFKVARFLWIFTAFINFFFFSVVILPGTYMEYYYVLVPGITLSLYTKNTVPWVTVVVGFMLFLTPYYFIKVYPEDYVERLEVPAVLGVFLSIFFLVKYFKKTNLENERIISIAYDTLEETKKSELAHLQLKSLKAQMNPHFMFNAMNSIQNLVLKGDKHEAYQYLSKFSNLIRENLNMSEKSFVSFDEELSLLKKYLELEKLRFRDDFIYLLIGEDIDSNIRVPSMIIQPFIENAIKHGLLHKINTVKHLTIEFVVTDVLKCIITDNGIGIKKSREINKQNENKSFSTDAIHQRLEFLKDYYKSDIGFKYIEVKEGTQVEIRIPYLTKINVLDD